MNRKEIEVKVIQILLDECEIENPGLDENLKDIYAFNSIDLVGIIIEVEQLLGSNLSRDEKEQAATILTLRDIIDYVEEIAKRRSLISD